MSPKASQDICRKAVLLLFVSLTFLVAGAQSNTADTIIKKKVSDYFTINGYIKDMGTFDFVKDLSTLTPANLFHNRINIKIKPVNHFIIAAEVRTRLLISQGDFLIPNFASQYTKDNGIINMSFNWVNKSPMLFNTFIDRLYLDWSYDQWNLRLGRQRLNWGMNLTWNPNDIFNTYNFLDFDYEERPGTDAAKFQYNFTPFNNIEGAFSPARNVDSMIGAVKYAFNTHSYDIQFLAGNYCRNVVIGTGWAGSIKNAGFKGEVSYFQDWYDKSFKNVALSASTTIDYSFNHGWYMSGTFLYNNLAPDKIDSATQLQAENLSPKMLMPTKYNFLVQVTKQFSPVWNGTLAFVYSPILNLFIVSPTVSYSIATNWDIDLIVQSYYDNNSMGKFAVLGNSFNLRLKWSFSN